MNTKQTKSLVHMASELSKKATSYLEQAQACSEHKEGHTLEFAEDAMFYWEQAHDAFEELSEVVDIIKESNKVSPKPRKPLEMPSTITIHASPTASHGFSRNDAPTVPAVQILPPVWEDWDEQGGEEE